MTLYHPVVLYSPIRNTRMRIWYKARVSGGDAARNLYAQYDRNYNTNFETSLSNQGPIEFGGTLASVAGTDGFLLCQLVGDNITMNTSYAFLDNLWDKLTGTTSGQFPRDVTVPSLTSSSSAPDELDNAIRDFGSSGQIPDNWLVNWQVTDIFYMFRQFSTTGNWDTKAAMWVRLAATLRGDLSSVSATALNRRSFENVAVRFGIDGTPNGTTTPNLLLASESEKLTGSSFIPSTQNVYTGYARSQYYQFSNYDSDLFNEIFDARGASNGAWVSRTARILLDAS